MEISGNFYKKTEIPLVHKLKQIAETNSSFLHLGRGFYKQFFAGNSIINSIGFIGQHKLE